MSLAARIIDRDGPSRIAFSCSLSLIHSENLWCSAGGSANLIAQPLQAHRCTPKLYQPFVCMHMAGIGWHWLPSHAVFGQVLKHNLQGTAPSKTRSFVRVVKPRRRACASSPQACECWGGPPHQEAHSAHAWRPRILLPSAHLGLLSFFSIGRDPEVSEAAAAAQDQGLDEIRL